MYHFIACQVALYDIKHLVIPKPPAVTIPDKLKHYIEQYLHTVQPVQQIGNLYFTFHETKQKN